MLKRYGINNVMGYNMKEAGKTQHTPEMRAAFEAAYPVPEHVFWHNVRYSICTPTVIWDTGLITEYNARWEAWSLAWQHLERQRDDLAREVVTLTVGLGEAKQQRDELLVENRWLVATMEWLSDPENKGGVTTCRKHNGYGFQSDCAICSRLNAIAKARGAV